MASRFTLLQTFVTVARSGSMKQAAGLLSVTPGAISQRIRLLEEKLGYRLFVRGRQGVRLDGQGAVLFATLDPPFRTIETVERELAAGPAQRVTVNTVASFAASWLVPRLGGFAGAHPGIDIAVETDNRLVDLRREPVDLAIRHGLGDYPGCDAVRLVAPEFIVIASPGLLAAGPPITGPADCLRFPLLHDLARGDWPLWLDAQGVPPPPRLAGPGFSDDQLLIRAALAGQGLALVRDVYAGDELQAGRLVRALDVAWPSRLAYYVVTRPVRELRPAVRLFRKWLIDQAATGGDRPAD